MKFRIFLFMVAMTLIAGAVLAQDPPTYTCAYIQQNIASLEGERVRVTGVAIVESARYGYALTAIADPSGVQQPWAAVGIYEGNDGRLLAERGQIVEAVGIVTEYYEFTEIVTYDETEFPPITTGWGTIPEPLQTTTGAYDQEMYESCLIRMFNVEVLSNPDEFGNIAIDDGSGEGVLLMRSIDEPPQIGHVFECLTGHNYFHFGEFKNRTRDEDDWVCDPGQPTATPSSPPGSPTPSPTPTPDTGGCDPEMDIYFEGHNPSVCFQGGDSFHARFSIDNPCTVERSFDFYIALEVLGNYYFYPTWSENVDKVRIAMPAGDTIVDDIIQPFAWPEGAGALAGLNFYAVMTDPDTITVLGDLRILTFCYE